MTYCMEAAAELGIQFIVLDRPNPLGNRIIAGGVIEPDCASFIGDDTGGGWKLFYRISKSVAGLYGN